MGAPLSHAESGALTWPVGGAAALGRARPLSLPFLSHSRRSRLPAQPAVLPSRLRRRCLSPVGSCLKDESFPHGIDTAWCRCRAASCPDAALRPPPGHTWSQAWTLASRRHAGVSCLPAEPGDTAGTRAALARADRSASLTSPCAQSRVVSTLPQRVDLYFEGRPLRRYMCAPCSSKQSAGMLMLRRARAQVVWHQRLFGVLRGQHGVAVVRRARSERHRRRRRRSHLRGARHTRFLRGVAQPVRAAAVYKRRIALTPPCAAPSRCGSCIASRLRPRSARTLAHSLTLCHAQLGFVYALISDSFKLGG